MKPYTEFLKRLIFGVPNQEVYVVFMADMFF